MVTNFGTFPRAGLRPAARSATPPAFGLRAAGAHREAPANPT
jgi:hypothetical protein